MVTQLSGTALLNRPVCVDKRSIGSYDREVIAMEIQFPLVGGEGELIWDFRPSLSEPTLGAMRTVTVSSQEVLGAEQCADLSHSGRAGFLLLRLPHTCSPRIFFSSS